MVILVKSIQTPLGDMEAGVDPEQNAVVFFDFHNRKSFASLKEKRMKKWGELEYTTHALHNVLETQISEYFGGIRKNFDIPIKLSGTEFEVNVWSALIQIEYGQTLSYGQLSKNMGRSSYLSRAVGRANSQNCIAIIVPCHRVIGANGKLVGYGGGLDRKESLLKLEAKTNGQTSLDEFI